MRRYHFKMRIEDDVNVDEAHSKFSAFIRDFIGITEADAVEEKDNIENGNGIVTRRQSVRGEDIEGNPVMGEIYEREVYRAGHVTSYTIEVELEELW